MPMGPIWNTSGIETVISVPVSVLGPERAGTEIASVAEPLILSCYSQEPWLGPKWAVFDCDILYPYYRPIQCCFQ